jgi:hypothetical protein
MCQQVSQIPDGYMVMTTTMMMMMMMMIQGNSLAKVKPISY